MKYVQEDPPLVELSRRNLRTLLDKLNDPLSQRELHSPQLVPNQPYIRVVAVEDSEHYSDRPAGEVYMPSGDPFDRLIEQLKDEQHKRCAYGSREGDGRTCDCKYMPPMFMSDHFVLRGEVTGCCELRSAIWTLQLLQKKEKENND